MHGVYVAYGDYDEIDLPTSVDEQENPIYTEPVSWPEIKAHLKLSSDAEQELVMSYVTAARVWCEKYLQRALVPKDITMYYTERAGHFALKYHHNPDEPITLSIDGDVIDTPISVLRGRLRHDVVSFALDAIPRQFSQITINYISAPYDKIEAIKPAIMMMTGKMYSKREDMEISGSKSVIKNILNYHRIKTR